MNIPKPKQTKQKKRSEKKTLRPFTIAEVLRGNESSNYSVFFVRQLLFWAQGWYFERKDGFSERWHPHGCNITSMAHQILPLSRHTTRGDGQIRGVVLLSAWSPLGAKMGDVLLTFLSLSLALGNPHLPSRESSSPLHVSPLIIMCIHVSDLQYLLFTSTLHFYNPLLFLFAQHQQQYK